MTGRSMDIGIVVVVTAVYLALAAIFPAIAQQTQVVEDWRAIRSETTGVMLDLDPANNVFSVGETISRVVTRKYAPDGPLLWERSPPPFPTELARRGYRPTLRATRSSRPTGSRGRSIRRGGSSSSTAHRGTSCGRTSSRWRRGGPSASRRTMPATLT